MHFRCLSGGVKTEVRNRNVKFGEMLRMDMDIGDSSTYVITKHKQQRVIPREQLRERRLEGKEGEVKSYS